jgi:hypothetical protein
VLRRHGCKDLALVYGRHLWGWESLAAAQAPAPVPGRDGLGGCEGSAPQHVGGDGGSEGQGQGRRPARDGRRAQRTPRPATALPSTRSAWPWREVRLEGTPAAWCVLQPWASAQHKYRAASQRFGRMVGKFFFMYCWGGNSLRQFNHGKF